VTGLDLIVALGVVLLACRLVAHRTHVAAPVLQLACGVVLGFAPSLRAVHLSPDAVLLLFLPALLYWECLTTGLRTVVANLRVIVLLSTLLVAVSSAAIAVVAHALRLPWGPAWVLGAALAPTDATTTGVLAGKLPKRMISTVRAESLVNDGTALVIYSVAVETSAGGAQVDALHVSGLLALSYAGGVASGLTVAYLSNQIRRRLDDSLAANINVLIAPFAAFLLAETLNASGVLGVVTCGLVALRKAPEFGRPDGRLQRDAAWGLGTYVLNGALFALVGVQAQSAVRALSGTDLKAGLVLVCALTATAIGVRLAWFFTTPYLIRALDRRPVQRQRRMGARGRFVYGILGFRGAVSLAAVLAVPQVTRSGAAYPSRDLIVFAATGVIAATLGQALILPAVIRWARLSRDDSEAHEHAIARTAMLRETLNALDRLAQDLGTGPAAADRMRQDYEHRLLLDQAPPDEPAVRDEHEYEALALAALRLQRDVLLRLRDERRIDDDVLVREQSRLDQEMMRLR
jgi:monovalent cation/hydrogen antiporter